MSMLQELQNGNVGPAGPITIWQLAEAYDRLCDEREAAYVDRNLLLALVCRFAVYKPYGKAWVALDPKEAADSEWRFVVFVEFADVQLTYHIHERERCAVFGFLPDGPNTWDGHTTEIKRERIEALIGSEACGGKAV